VAIPVSISTPAGGLGPDDELVFVVEHDGLPDTLTADVTLADGSVERAWDYDQAVNGYIGSIEVDGTTRTYALRRPIGWPFGGVSLAVNVGSSGGGPSELFTQTFNNSVVHTEALDSGTYTSGGALSCVKSIPIDFSGLPAEKLFLKFTQGEFKSIFGVGNHVEIQVGGTATGNDGTVIWGTGNSGTGGNWVNINTASEGHDGHPPYFFDNPNPSGTSYIKLFSQGAGGGFRNFALELHHGVTGMTTDAPGVGKTIAVPFEDWGAQALSVEVTGQVRIGSSWQSTPMIIVRALRDDDDTEFGQMSLVQSGSSQTLSGTFAARTFEDAGLYGGTALDPVGTFASPGVPARIEVYVPFDTVSFAPGATLLKDFTLTISGSGGDDEGSASRSWTVDGDVSAASRTIIQYREAPKLNKLIRLHQHIFAQLTEVARQINELDDPSVATGVNLDVTAELVGQSRVLPNGDVASDEDMRILIPVRVARNNSTSTAPRLKELLQLIFGVRVEVNDLEHMSASYGIGRVPTADEIALLDQDILPRAMGVKTARYHFDESNYFGFEEDPDSTGYADFEDDPDGGGYADGF
jgi:hypothetical protein